MLTIKVMLSCLFIILSMLIYLLISDWFETLWGKVIAGFSMLALLLLWGYRITINFWR